MSASTVMAPVFSNSSALGLAADWAFDSLDREVSGMSPDLAAFAAGTEWRNALILPAAVRSSMPRIAAAWLRNFVAGSLLYYGVGLMWCAVIYGLCRSRFFKHGGMPSLSAQLAQIWVSQQALVWYTLMPTIGEWMAENGLTRCSSTVSGMGGVGPYILWTALYLFIVEFMIYWIHRALHHPLIKWLHAIHHQYNTGASLSPWAGLAFHPLDGMLQASPYVVLLAVIPVHFWTFEMMLFATAIWTTNIHDALVGKTEPVMGSAYHTLHHTEWNFNYGQYFILFDWVFGTLLVPDYKTAGASLQAAWAEEDKPKKA